MNVAASTEVLAESGPSRLQQLRQLSVLVADTGDIDAVRRWRPIDCTTNPTLVRKALALPVYAPLVEAQLAWGRRQGGDPDRLAAELVDRLTIDVGVALADLIPGRVSTEVDADLAYDTAATVAKAQQFVQRYADAGIGRERVLIKIAATWEGILAAAHLQREGIDCNLTLIFNPTQAIACAEAGAFLISPFVGRILDWHVAREQRAFGVDEDPGVLFVRGVYREFKRRGHDTVVMGASFRSTAQVEALAGCDRLTVAPDLLEQLEQASGPVIAKLAPVAAVPSTELPVDAQQFVRAFDHDAMATEKLAGGVAAFAQDLAALRQTITLRLAGATER
ncbi:MAG TPA: transaldolase [Rhodanobacter sp.]